MTIRGRLEAANRWLLEGPRQRLLSRLALLYGVIFIAATILTGILAPGIAYGSHGLVGGDFLAFYTAGDMVLQGRALEAYEFAAFDAELQSRVPIEGLGLMWQYPPVMFFLTGVLALVPYKLSLWLWLTGTAAVFCWSLNRILVDQLPASDRRPLIMALVLASPLCLAVVQSGQISLLTAGLMMMAVYRPRAYWLVAGIGAGLLTVKPQLGVIIPLAFLMAGAWRAIAVAALTAALLHTSALLVFGPESFTAFLDAVVRLQSDVAGSGVHTPPVNMTTLFGQLRYWDVGSGLAMGAHLALAVAVVVIVTWAWWRYGKSDTQGLYLAALVGGGAILVTPYAYAYEMAALVPAAIWLALAGGRSTGLSALLIVTAWGALIGRDFLPLDRLVQMPFLISLGAFVLLAAAGPGDVTPGRTKQGQKSN